MCNIVSQSVHQIAPKYGVFLSGVVQPNSNTLFHFLPDLLIPPPTSGPFLPAFSAASFRAFCCSLKLAQTNYSILHVNEVQSRIPLPNFLFHRNTNFCFCLNALSSSSSSFCCFFGALRGFFFPPSLPDILADM